MSDINGVYASGVIITKNDLIYLLRDFQLIVNIDYFNYNYYCCKQVVVIVNMSLTLTLWSLSTVTLFVVNSEDRTC